MKNFLVLFWLFLGVFISGCTTTKISSIKDFESTSKYDNLLVLFFEPDIGRKKVVEDGVTAALVAAGVNAKQGYRVLPPIKKYSNEEFVDAIVNAGSNAILSIKNTENSSETLNVQSTINETAMDSRGNLYTYSAPIIKSYKSSANGFRVELLDMRSQKIVWLADSRSHTISPAKWALFTDFYESSVKSFAEKMIEKMRQDGVFVTK